MYSCPPFRPMSGSGLFPALSCFSSTPYNTRKGRNSSKAASSLVSSALSLLGQFPEVFSGHLTQSLESAG
jgi:hypothetical protein